VGTFSLGSEGLMGRKVIAGVVLAAALAIVPANVSIAGIEGWKIVLAAIGFAIFATAGRK